MLGEIGLLGNEEVLKFTFYEKLQKLFNKILSMVRKTTMVESLPSFDKILSNQI